MMAFSSKSLWSAFAALVAIAAVGCSAPSNECPAGQKLDAATNACVADLCAGVDCSRTPNTGCDPVSGACKNLCTGVANPPKCTAPAVCVPTTGQCVDLCAGKTCDAGTSCQASTGKCVSLCELAKCSPEEFCDASTQYACQPYCETNKRPTGKPACGAGLKCQKTSGECVGLCTDVNCDYGEGCDPTDGLCRGGVPGSRSVGAACSVDEDCGAGPAVAGQTWECSATALLGPAPGGYCTATCEQTIPCPSGSVCFSGQCLDQCAADSDCRGLPGYRCLPVGWLTGDDTLNGQYACLASPQCTAASCSPAGGDCADDGDCLNGAFCFTEENARTGEYTGFDRGYCLYPMRSSDTCPPNSTPIPLSQTDRDFTVCFKNCTLNEYGLGEPTSCGLGESCLQTQQNSPAGVCWFESCDVDAQCQETACGGAAGTDNCGKGQKCLKADGTEVTGTQEGTCRRPDKCTADADCPKVSSKASKCDTVRGECTVTTEYCEPSIGQCTVDCTVASLLHDATAAGCENLTCPAGQFCNAQTGGKCESGVCPNGTTCSATTKRCERGCTDDAACGENGVCESGTCVARCTKHNEANVCGAGKVCRNDGRGRDGHCADKCTATNGVCGADQRCEASTGRCLNRCDDPVAPTACAASFYCDGGASGDGTCKAFCTETSCTGGTFCQVSTGRCRPACKNDPSVCGAEECNVDAANPATSICGVSCQFDTECGLSVDNTALNCLDVAGITPAVKRCQRPACTVANEATVCGAAKLCQTSTGKCLADCANDASICGAEKCNVDGATGKGRCGKECADSTQCGQDPSGAALTCQPVSGSTIQRCQ
jgi:hypothetical protein